MATHSPTASATLLPSSFPVWTRGRIAALIAAYVLGLGGMIGAAKHDFVGKRSLGAEEIADDNGQVRLIFRTPNWEDFVHLAFREIRHCGATSIQVARRLRAMALNLIDTLPEHRHAALRAEIGLLDRALDSQGWMAEDLALARVPDAQGLGGSSGARPE